MNAQPRFLDLYHRTTPEAAQQIHETGRMVSKESTQDAFFSTRRDSEHTEGYGEAVVHIRVPADWIEKGWVVLEDEFALDEGEWEDHYVIKAKLIQPEHIVES